MYITSDYQSKVEKSHTICSTSFAIAHSDAPQRCCGARVSMNLGSVAEWRFGNRSYWKHPATSSKPFQRVTMSRDLTDDACTVCLKSWGFITYTKFH